MWMKLQEQLPSSIKWESTFPFISCHWAADQKHTHSTQEKLPNLQWQEDGDTLQDSMSTYSEMPGVPKEMMKDREEQRLKDIAEIKKWI